MNFDLLTCFICEHRFVRGERTNIVQVIDVTPEQAAAAPKGSLHHVVDNEYAVLICNTCVPIAKVAFPPRTAFDGLLELKAGHGKTVVITPKPDQTTL